MKNYFTILILLFGYGITYACSCEYIPSFCQHSKDLLKNETGLIFIGELIDEEDINEFRKAYQFKVIEKIHGEIVTPSSPFYEDLGYDNTATTVWVFGGDNGLCYESALSGKSLIATSFQKDYNSGYTPNSCTSDFFHIDENGMMNGSFRIMHFGEQVHTSEINEIINNECTSSVEEFKNEIERNIEIYPNPFCEYLEITSNQNLMKRLHYEITDIRGKAIQIGALSDGKIDIDTNDLQSGVYLISFTDGQNRYSKKIIKQ